MEWHPISTIILYLLFVFLSHTIADLISDREALLDFAASVPHDRKLFWNSTSSVCSWVGVTCTAEGSRVLSLRLPGIGLHGPIPSNTLGKLDALTILSLRSNALSGKLPSDIISLPSLQYMYLQDNRFSGIIPSSLSSHLTVLDLSFNSFTGSIPPAIQNLTRLMVLSLQNNSLSGSIPVLELPKLRHLNLSYNHLNGSIPSAIHNFPAPSFEGNDMLCGKPLNPCSTFMPAPSPFPVIIPPAPLVALKPNGGSRKKLSTRAIVAIAVGGSAVLFLLLLIFCCCQRRKDTESSGVLKVQSGSENPKQDFGSGVQEAEKNKLIFFQGSTYSFDLEDLLRASAEVLGKGSYGTAYKAILEDGTIVVVKRLKELVVGKREFEQQMEIVGRLLQHPNIVPLRAYYYSKDEKLLVYDYISAGNLSALLLGDREIGRTPLDWETRVRIVLGAARGLAHIHSSGGGRLIHGNIKSSNVLLVQDFQGCLSDFGLTPLMGCPAVPSRSAGHRAPEVIDTRKCSQKSDIYSFGVLLLEMLTGKAAVQSAGHEDAVDLPRWVQSVVREEWTSEVFDVELMKYQNIEEELVQMLQVAMACVSNVPDMRPTVVEVARMIEEIRPDSGNPASSDENKSKSSNAQTP